MEPSLKGKVMAGQVFDLGLCPIARLSKKDYGNKSTTGMLIRRKNKPCY